MTNPTARDLIQRLADALEGAIKHQFGWGEPDYDGELITEARAYLAAHPEPVAEPTEEEHVARIIYEKAQRAADTQYGIFWPKWEALTDFEIGECVQKDCAFDAARAILARYGNQRLQPSPVSERPWERPGWCDAEGRCWWSIVEQPGQFPHWIYAPSDVVSWAGCLASLPHWAIPVPEVQS